MGTSWKEELSWILIRGKIFSLYSIKLDGSSLWGIVVYASLSNKIHMYDGKPNGQAVSIEWGNLISLPLYTLTRQNEQEELLIHRPHESL